MAASVHAARPGRRRRAHERYASALRRDVWRACSRRASGQIVGPTIVGWVADSAGGLRLGFAVSAGMLALGALLASRQRALQAPAPERA